MGGQSPRQTGGSVTMGGYGSPGGAQWGALGGLLGGLSWTPVSGPSRAGGENCPKTVPTGRVIKYPKKCALFCPPGAPGGPPRGGPFWGHILYPPNTPINCKILHKRVQKGVKKGPFLGPVFGPFLGPPGAPRAGGAPGPGGPEFPGGEILVSAPRAGGPPGAPPGGPPGGGSDWEVRRARVALRFVDRKARGSPDQPGGWGSPRGKRSAVPALWVGGPPHPPWAMHRKNGSPSPKRGPMREVQCIERSGMHWKTEAHGV